MNFSAIATHRFLLRAALSAGNVFAWILVFHALYYSGETPIGALIGTTLAYAGAQALAFFLTPISGMNLTNGTQRSILYATLALSSAFIWLAAAAAGVFGSGPENIWIGVVGFAFLQGLYRAFYWIPYRASLHGIPRQKTNYLLEIFLTLMPLAASVILTGTVGGAWILLVGCAALVFISSLALVGIRESYEPYLWRYSDTMRAFASPDTRELVSGSILHGIQGAALLFAWPLAIFVLFDWSYQILGAVMSLTLLFTLLGKRLFRRFSAKTRLEDSHSIDKTLVASSWVVRLLVFSPATIVLADIMYHLGSPSRHAGLDQFAYEQAADTGLYIDHASALKEMGYALGRVIFSMALIALAFFGSPVAALAVAIALAAAASMISLLRRPQVVYPVI